MTGEISQIKNAPILAKIPAPRIAMDGMSKMGGGKVSNLIPDSASKKSHWFITYSIAFKSLYRTIKLGLYLATIPRSGCNVEK